MCVKIGNVNAVNSANSSPLSKNNNDNDNNNDNYSDSDSDNDNDNGDDNFYCQAQPILKRKIFSNNKPSKK